MLRYCLHHLRSSFKPRTAIFKKTPANSIGCRALRSWLFLGFLAALALPVVRADEVLLAGRPLFRAVRVLSFQNGRLTFLGTSGETLRKDIREIESVKIDGMEDLNAAERIRVSGGAAESIVVYERALESDLEPWRRQLILARLVRAADEAGRFADAIGAFIRLAGEHPDAAEVVRPWRAPDPDDPSLAASRQLLSEAIQGTRGATSRQTMRNYMTELELYSGSRRAEPEAGRVAESEPAAPSGEAAPGGGEPPAVLGEPSESDARSADQPGREPPRLFGEDTGTVETPRDRAQRPVERAEPASRSSARQADPRRSAAGQLPQDTILLRIAARAFDAGDASLAVGVLEAALPQLPSERVFGARILLGRARIEAGQPASAAAEMVSVVESASDPLLVAEAQYYVGVAHEALGRPGIAERAYRELLEPGAGTSELRALARMGLERVTRPSP